MPAATLFPLSSLISASFFVNASNAAITTMIGVAIAGRGGTQEQVSLIATFYALGIIVGYVLSPRFIERYGYVRAFSAGAAVLTIVVVAMDIFSAFEAWAILRFLMGLSIASVTAVTDAWINGKSPDDKRGRILAFYSITLGLAAIMSQLVFLFADSTNEDFVLGFAIAMNVAVVLVALTKASPPSIHRQKRTSLITFNNVSTMASLSVFVSGFVQASLFAVLPFYFTKNGVEPGLVAMAIASIYLGRLLFQWPIGAISDRSDRQNLLAILFAVIAATMLLTVIPGAGGEGRIISGEAGPLLQAFTFISLLLIGGALYPVYTVASGFAFSRVGDQPLIHVSTTLLILNAAGAFIGPLMITLVSPIAGIWSLHIVIIVITSLAAAFCMLRRESVLPNKEKVVNVVSMPQTSIEMAHAAAEESKKSSGDDKP